MTCRYFLSEKRSKKAFEEYEFKAQLASNSIYEVSRLKKRRRFFDKSEE